MAIRIGEVDLAPVTIDDISIDAEIAYRDGEGHPTRRKVTIHGADGHAAADGSITLTDFRGYCHLRKAARTFRIDRIAELIDPATGEVVRDAGKWLLGQLRTEPTSAAPWLPEIATHAALPAPISRRPGWRMAARVVFSLLTVAAANLLAVMVFGVATDPSIGRANGIGLITTIGLATVFLGRSAYVVGQWPRPARK